MQMAGFAAEYQIKFVTGLGDNFYETGITNLQDKQLTKKFEVSDLLPMDFLPSSFYELVLGFASCFIEGMFFAGS